MVKETKSKKVRKITLGFVLSYLFGGVFAFFGLLVLTESFLGGLTIMALSLTITPYFSKQIKKKFNVELSGGLKVFLAFIILILFIVSIMGIGKEAIETEQLSADELKTAARSVPYDDLYRYNEEYVGEVVYYKGQVLQVLSNWNITELRIATKKSEYDESYYDDIIYVVGYKGTRLMEDDIVDVWAKSDSLVTYESISGELITIPLLVNPHIEYVGQAEY